MTDVTAFKKHHAAVNNWLIDNPSGSIIHLITGEKKRLGEYQLKMLEVLAQNSGVILSREELTALVWEERVIGNNSLPNAIHALRVALEDDGKYQRIIKTIPKKGYLLEKEYCRFIEIEENEAEEKAQEVSSDDAPTAKTESNDAELMPTEDPVTLSVGDADTSASTSFALAIHQTAQEPPRVSNKRRWIAISIGVVICLFLGIGWYLYIRQNSQLTITEQEKSAYSNIDLFELSRPYEPSHSDWNVTQLLKPTLYNINQQLKLKSTTMETYYYSVEKTLNYTFILESKCDKVALSMAIAHWSNDPVQLNNLILRETRRKLNEMAICPAG